MIPRHNRQATAEALFHLSQAQRRLSHRSRVEAIEAELRGNYKRFAHYTKEARRLWRDAKWHFERARREFWEIGQ